MQLERGRVKTSYARGRGFKTVLRKIEKTSVWGRGLGRKSQGRQRGYGKVRQGGNHCRQRST